MGGFCGRTCGLVGPFGVTGFGGRGCGCTCGLVGVFGVTGFGGRGGGFSGLTGEFGKLFGITYTPSSRSSVSWGLGGIGGGLGFAGGDFDGAFSDPDLDGGFDLGGGGGGVSGKMNLSNNGVVLSVKLPLFVGLAPSGPSF